MRLGREVRVRRRRVVCRNPKDLDFILRVRGKVRGGVLLKGLWPRGWERRALEEGPWPRGRCCDPGEQRLRPELKKEHQEEERAAESENKFRRETRPAGEWVVADGSHGWRG